jgi:hypothetical protein
VRLETGVPGLLEPGGVRGVAREFDVEWRYSGGV